MSTQLVTMSDDWPDELTTEPPSSTLIYAALDADGPLTVRDLMDRLPESRTTIVDTLARLEDAGLVDHHPDPANPQRHCYHIV